MMCSTKIPRLILGGASALFAASLAAAPIVLLEKARIVPSDGAPEGGFGRAVAISGNVAVVTANSQSSIRGAGPEQYGAAYVFERDSGGVWRQTAKLASGRLNDLYGSDAAVDGNVIAIGSVFSGATHVYEKQSGAWQPVAVLGGLSGEGSGYSIAIENNLLAISRLSPHGMVIYRRDTSGWVKIADYINGEALADDDYFGPAVDLSQNVAIHGSWGSDDPERPMLSTAFVYTPGAGGNWAQPSISQITQPGALSPNGFSSSVSIAPSTALISSYVFTRNSAGQWINVGNIHSAAELDDDDVTVLALPSPFRYVTLSRRTGTSAWPWPVRAELTTSDAGQITGLSTDNGRALLSSYRNNVAYVYEPPTNLDRADLSQDDFQDGDAIGWSTTPGSLFSVASSGTFRFYRQSSVAGNSAALWQTTIGNDQAIQADITPRAFDGADRWFGLVTRYSDINNYYYVTARSGGGVQLKRIRAGAFTTLGSAPLPIAIGTTNRIRLESVGDHVRVLVNDRPVIRVRDAALSGGRPGLMTYKTRADFDNIIVNPNPGYVAFNTDFEGVVFNMHIAAGNWSRLQVNGGWLLRNTDVTGGTRVLISNAGFSSFGTLGNQIVQADLRPTQFSGADRWVGLIARYRDEGNYHYVTLRSSGALDIKKLANGNIQTLASVPFTVQTNVNYRVRLEAIGTRLRVYVNGTLRAEATDSTLTRAVSSAGVATYKAAADLDNFLVAQP